MAPASMNSKRWVLDSTDAALMVAASPADPANSSTPSEEMAATPFGENLAWTLVRFHDRFGTTWVNGRFLLRAETLEFRPHRSVLVGGELTYVTVRFPEVLSIRFEPHLFSKTVKIAISSGHVISLRCRSAKALADRLVTVIAASRSRAA